MKYLLVFFTASVLITSCLEECPNEVSRDLTQTDLDWFACEPHDTTFYKDAESGEIYYLVCESCETGEVRHFVDDHYCENEGYYRIRKYIDSEYNTNLPHYLNDLTKINMHFETLGQDYSVVDIWFEGLRESTFSYILGFLFKPGGESLEEVGDRRISEIIHKERIVIDGKDYFNVYILVAFTWNDEHSNAYYDTLYYNRVGFLKFISSQYGYRLERME